MKLCCLDGSRFYTFGQVAPEAVVTGKPTHNAVAMELLQTAPRTNPEAQVPLTLEEAQRVLKEFRENKLAFVAWLLLTAVFAAFYGIYLERLYLALGAGVVFTVITAAMYFSPWFNSSDGLFTLMTFMVATFVVDFLCAFLSVLFGSTIYILSIS